VEAENAKLKKLLAERDLEIERYVAFPTGRSAVPLR
jgi:hypothetical protein